MFYFKYFVYYNNLHVTKKYLLFYFLKPNCMLSKNFNLSRMARSINKCPRLVRASIDI